MIKKIADATSRSYNMLLAMALKTCGFKADFCFAASIVYQIDYWIEIYKKDEANKPDNEKKHYKNGKWWVYNKVENWRQQFPFASKRTMERTLIKLESLGILETGCHNNYGWDRTKWYTLDYKLLESLMQQEYDKLSQSKNTSLSKSKATSCRNPMNQFDGHNTKEYTNSKTNSYFKPKSKNRNSFTQGMSNQSETDFAELEKLLVEN